ncbi:MULTISPECIES: hypothetical protein [Pedobacter]|uniref:hypothetical protein n=1 Tax=Pedobacter TaxID=84567 RepID=UPI00122AC1F6|nr:MULTISPECIES: hypothetical protein [Pedobacter]RZJ89077.1 MAG: hypothetical protein EOO20_11925 [Chryseobacterium sp.]
MLRLGKITNIDRTTGIGTITDINEQEIEFSYRNVDLELKLNQQIWFNIEMSSTGLIVSKITLLFITIPKENENHNLFIYNNFISHNGRFTL